MPRHDRRTLEHPQDCRREVEAEESVGERLEKRKAEAGVVLVRIVGQILHAFFKRSDRRLGERWRPRLERLGPGLRAHPQLPFPTEHRD